MGMAYKIKFLLPADYDAAALLHELPSPIDRTSMFEIYNFRVDADGFYFIDHLVDNEIASIAFRRFVNVALSYSQSIEILAVSPR
jgi:hypothetical protein